MKVLILGSDGYIGYPLTIHLLKRGYDVFGIDNFSRRERVHEIGSNSLTPIQAPSTRKEYLRSRFGESYLSTECHLGVTNPNYIRSVLGTYEPDAIVHLAEQPSAPWSMIDPFKASITQHDNVIGTLHLLWAMKEECPDAHLIKLGTMGEYGTPDCDIPEGVIPNQPCCWTSIQNEKLSNNSILKAKCPMSGLLFPRSPFSFYHLSKVHDTYNVKFCCDNWKLSSTDIMQGIVFGLMGSDPQELTRFDYDEYFGTVINRFCTQAISGLPLTVYGLGEQQRGFLPLKDSIQCLTLAIENPPERGEYRTFNQFENIYSLNKLAKMVKLVGERIELNVELEHIPNPRVEKESHYYNPVNENLLNLGYEPTRDIEAEIDDLMRTIYPFRDRVKPNVIMPKTKWM